MRNYFYILFLFVGFTSCDDGDIIINNFDFEDATLTSCKKAGKAKVLYIINNDDIFETISLQATNTAFSEEADVLSTNTSSDIRFDLSTSNKLTYRTYDGTVPPNYFCSDIPPSNPKVNEEFISVGGTVVINTIAEFNSTDKDGDGVPDAEELDEDTDGDGIMNVDDNDDDGDNILTSTEIANFNEDAVNEDGYRDTDEDGTANYLDDDDDNDTVKTKREVSEESQDPTAPENRNADGLANYLNPLIKDEFTGEIAIVPNVISVTYRSSIIIQNLQLQNQNGSGEVISFETYDLGDFISATTLITSPTPANTDN
ncbi:hypothetical protein [Gillisia marina]|uniref:hypothetical protein n=1 Tax=Gillisia marina TaxID=1167637 RepID=UPI000318BDE1|nr:hypothetical protein [Gillisia marina]